MKCMAKMPILVIVLLSGLTCANAAGATASVTATMKLGNASYADLMLADTAREGIVNYLRSLIDNVPLASTDMDGLYPSTQDDVVIANASITIEGTQTGEEAKAAVQNYLNSNYINEDIVNAELNKTLGVPDEPPYVESVDFSVTAEADVPAGGIATMFAAIRLGSSDYKEHLFGNLTTRVAAEVGLTNFVANIPGASVEAGDLSRGYEPDIVLALAAVKVENTKNSTEAKNKLEEYREEIGFNVDALNAKLVKELGDPPVSGVSFVTEFEEIRISVPDQDQDSGPGRVIVYFVLTMGKQEYRDLVLNQIEQAGGTLSVVMNFLESASDVKLVSIGEGSGDLNVKAVFDVAVEGTQTNSEARDLLQSLPLDEYSETATTAIRGLLNSSSFAEDLVTRVIISGASAKKDRVPEKGRSSSASITLQDVTFQESDYEGKTRVYLDFENEYLSNIEGFFKRKCGCEAAAEIANVTFSNNGGKRRLMATAATIETRMYNIDNGVVESAMSDLEEQCKTEGGCTLGGFSASVDVDSWRPLEDSSAQDPDNAAGAAHTCLALLMALLMGSLVK